MADTRLSDFSAFINQQIRAQELVETCLWKLEALIAIAATTDGFYDSSALILHNYFSIAGDLIEKAAKANQISLDELLKRDG